MYSLRVIIDICLLPIAIAAVAAILLYIIYRNTLKKTISKKYGQSNPNKATFLSVLMIILIIFSFAATMLGLSLYNLHQIKDDMSYLTSSNENETEKKEERYFDIFGNEYDCEHDVVLYDESGTAYRSEHNNLSNSYIGDNGKMFYSFNAYLNRGGCLICFNTDIEEDFEYTDNIYEIITADDEHLYWALSCYWDIDGNLIINPDGEDDKIIITKAEQEQYQLEHGIFLKNQISD